MPDRLSFGETLGALERAISITQQRHTLTSSNISNLETPGYKAKDIDFKSALDRALGAPLEIGLARTDPSHIGSETGGAGDAEAFEEEGEWNGYNWVSIDKEMARLTENNLRYRTATETLLRKLALLKEVIREGGR